MMKKLLWLVAALLVLMGCSQNLITGPQASPVPVPQTFCQFPVTDQDGVIIPKTWKSLDKPVIVKKFSDGVDFRMQSDGRNVTVTLFQNDQAMLVRPLKPIPEGVANAKLNYELKLLGPPEFVKYSFKMTFWFHFCTNGLWMAQPIGEQA